MSRSESLALEALPPHMPAALHVVEAPGMDTFDPFEHNVLLLPGDVEITNQDEKRARNLARLEACRAIRFEYADDSNVTRTVARYELPEDERGGVSKDSPLYELELDAYKYRMLEKPEVYPLFMAMERGLEAFVRLGGTTANASQEDVKAFIEHTAAHSILFHTNQRLALNIARRRYGTKFSKSPHFEDIALDATDALYRSLQLFNYHKKLALSTFVVTAIHTQTDRYIANHVRTIRMPTNVDTDHKRVIRITRDLTAKLGRDPTPAEVSDATKQTEKKIAELNQGGRYNLTSIDTKVSDDEDQSTTLGALLSDPRATNAHQKNVEDKELADTLSQTIEEADLSAAEMITLSLRNGYRIGAIEEAAPTVPIDELLDAADLLKDGLSYRSIAQALKLADLVEDMSIKKVKKIEETALDKLSRSKQLQALSLVAALDY